jgi:hypothetical protein
MGLKISTSLHTDKGNTSEMYLNIETFNINKRNMNHVMVNKYINKASRDANADDKCNCFEVSSSYILNVELADLETNYIYTLVYDKIKLELEGKGFTVETL